MMGCRPGLDCVPAPGYGASTGRLPGFFVTSPVTVRERVELQWEVLPAEPLDESWGSCQVASDSLQLCPIGFSRRCHPFGDFF